MTTTPHSTHPAGDPNWNYHWDMPLRVHDPAQEKPSRGRRGDGLPTFPGERRRVRRTAAMAHAPSYEIVGGELGKRWTCLCGTTGSADTLAAMQAGYAAHERHDERAEDNLAEHTARITGLLVAAMIEPDDTEPPAETDPDDEAENDAATAGEDRFVEQCWTAYFGDR